MSVVSLKRLTHAVVRALRAHVPAEIRWLTCDLVCVKSFYPIVFRIVVFNYAPNRTRALTSFMSTVKTELFKNTYIRNNRRETLHDGSQRRTMTRLLLYIICEIGLDNPHIPICVCKCPIYTCYILLIRLNGLVKSLLISCQVLNLSSLVLNSNLELPLFTFKLTYLKYQLGCLI